MCPQSTFLSINKKILGTGLPTPVFFIYIKLEFQGYTFNGKFRLGSQYYDTILVLEREPYKTKKKMCTCESPYLYARNYTLACLFASIQLY